MWIYLPHSLPGHRVTWGGYEPAAEQPHVDQVMVGFHRKSGC